MRYSLPLAPATSTAVSAPTVTVPLVSHSGSLDQYQGTVSRSSNHATAAELAKSGTAYHTIEQGEIEFQGQSADRTFIQDLKEKLGDWPGGDTTLSQLPPDMPLPGFFEGDRQLCDEVALPTKDLATKLVNAALDAQILLPIIHRPNFDAFFNLIYSLDKSEYSTREVRFLPLLYAVLAYGCLHVESDARNRGSPEMISQGYFLSVCRQRPLDQALTVRQVKIFY